MGSEELVVTIKEARRILGKRADILSDDEIRKLILNFDEQVQYILMMVPND